MKKKKIYIYIKNIKKENTCCIHTVYIHKNIKKKKDNAAYVIIMITL